MLLSPLYKAPYQKKPAAHLKARLHVHRGEKRFKAILDLIYTQDFCAACESGNTHTHAHAHTRTHTHKGQPRRPRQHGRRRAGGPRGCLGFLSDLWGVSYALLSVWELTSCSPQHGYGTRMNHTSHQSTQAQPLQSASQGDAVCPYINTSINTVVTLYEPDEKIKVSF